MNELDLKRRLSSNRVLSLAVMGALGVLLSYLHDVAQLAMFSVGEWAFYRFIAQDGPWTAIILVNFIYQAMAFAVPSILVLLLLTKLLRVESLRYPSVVYVAYLIFGLWWVPIALFGGSPDAAQILPVLPITIMATAVVYFGVAVYVVRRNAL